MHHFLELNMTEPKRVSGETGHRGSPLRHLLFPQTCDLDVPAKESWVPSIALRRTSVLLLLRCRINKTDRRPSHPVSRMSSEGTWD